MNGRSQLTNHRVRTCTLSQIQEGKNWILPKDINGNRFFRDSLAKNLEKPLMSIYGNEWRERDNGIWTSAVLT